MDRPEKPVKPKRKAVPMRIKRLIVKRQGGLCDCGCGAIVSADPKTDTHFDHVPPLALRRINKRRSDYIPKQHDAHYLSAKRSACHRKKTSGTGATTAGTDVGAITKQRHRDKKAAGKRRRSIWPSRPFPKRKRPWGLAKGRRR